MYINVGICTVTVRSGSTPTVVGLFVCWGEGSSAKTKTGSSAFKFHLLICQNLCICSLSYYE